MLGFLILFLGGLVGIYFLYVYFWKKSWQRQLTVALDFSKTTLFQEENFTLTETLTNQHLLTLPLLEISIPLKTGFAFIDETGNPVVLQRDIRQLYSLKGYEKIKRQIPLKAVKRGIYPLKTFEIKSKEFLTGAIESATYPYQKELIVYPKYYPPEKIGENYQAELGEFLSPHSLFQDPLTVLNIRQMESRDSFSQINWKKSAAMGELYANQYEVVSNQKVTLVLYLPQRLDWHHEKLAEGALSIFVTVAKSCLFHGMKLEIITNCCNRKEEEIYYPSLESMEPLLYSCASILFEKNLGLENILKRLEMSQTPRLIICSTGKELYQPLKEKLEDTPFVKVQFINAVESKSLEENQEAKEVVIR